MDFLRMLLAVSTLVCVPAAHASLIFSFSFDNSAGANTAGPITGEIHGLVDNTSQQKAAKVIITGIGSHSQFGHALPFDVIAGGWSVGNNAFDVAAGSVVSWNFGSFHDHLTTIVLELLDIGTAGGGTPFFAVSVQGESSPRLTMSSTDPQFVLLQASAPTPSVLVLLGIGCVGFFFFSRRRQPAAASL